MKYYCDVSLLKLVPSIVLYYLSNKERIIKNSKLKVQSYKIVTKSRSSTILPFFEQCEFNIHNGKKYIKLNVTKKHFFYKLGEFSFSKVICRHNNKNKKNR